MFWSKKPVPPNVYTEQEIDDYEPRKWRLYDYYKDQYEHDIKAATYLMTAHGACLLICFAALKDIISNAALKGFSGFIYIFVSGFFFAVLGFGFEIRARASVLIAASGPRGKWPRWIDNVAEVLQITSLLILFYGLFTIAERLRAL